MIRRITMISTLSLLASLMLGGCAKEQALGNDLEGVPEVAAVEMRLTEDPKTEGTATEDDSILAQDLAADELTQAASSESTPVHQLGQIREGIHDINQSLRDVLGPVAALVRDNPPNRELGKLRMWGPVTRGMTEYRFFLRHAEAHTWGWRLDARVAESDDEFEAVAAGKIVVGEVARRGAGVMGIDLDRLAAVEPTVEAQGQILLGFRHGQAGTSVAYAVRDFSRDPESQPPIDALLRAIHLKDGFNRVRLAYRANIEGSASDAEELVLARVRHRPTLGGRSDAIVTGGDIPESQAWVVSQCWNEDLVSRFRVVRDCSLDNLADADGCTVVESEGSADDCPKVLRAVELPPSNPTESDVDAQDPNQDLEPPEDMPDFDADTLDSD